MNHKKYHDFTAKIVLWIALYIISTITKAFAICETKIKLYAGYTA